MSSRQSLGSCPFKMQYCSPRGACQPSCKCIDNAYVYENIVSLRKKNTKKTHLFYIFFGHVLIPLAS